MTETENKDMKILSTIARDTSHGDMWGRCPCRGNVSGFYLKGGAMEKAVFEREMMRAKTMITVGDRPEYWAGYQRGLRRRFHGENFGTEEEHEKWLSLKGDSDPARDERGRGYRDGYQESEGAYGTDHH